MDGSDLVIVDTTGRLLTLADTPEFHELMASIDASTQGEYYGVVADEVRNRLEAAKEKLLSRVVK